MRDDSVGKNGRSESVRPTGGIQMGQIGPVSYVAFCWDSCAVVAFDGAPVWIR